MGLIDIFGYPAFYTGFVFCAFYILYPLLYTYVKTPAGFVWVPVNNQHRLCGDSRIYAAGVQEARLNFFKYKHPCAPETGNMAVDYTRVTSYRTAALLGLFIPDERIAFTLSFVASVLIQYVLAFFITQLVFGNAWVALMLSLLVIFWFKTFVYLSEKPCLYNGYNYVKTVLLNAHNTAFFENINDNFRYVVMSVAGIFTWITILLLLYLQSGPHLMPACITCILYFLLIPFVYPPTSLVSLALLTGTIAFQAVSANNYFMLLNVIICGVVALLLLLLSGLYGRIRDMQRASSEVLNMAHNSDETYVVFSKSMYHLLIKKVFFIWPLILFVATLPFLAGEPKLQFMSVILLIFIIMQIGGYILKKNTMVFRFMQRGGLHYLFFAIICSFTLLFLKLNLSNSVISMLVTLGAVIFMVVPFIGNLKMASAIQKSGAHYMPGEEWEVYRYIKSRTEARSAVLAFSFSNLQMLPVYTHANLTVRGAEWLEDPERELVKYIQGLSLTGADAMLLLDKFAGYFKNSFSCLLPQEQESDFKDHHLINTLLYFPYVTTMGGIRMTNTQQTGWSQEFMNYLEGLISQYKQKELPSGSFDYVLIDKEEFPGISLSRQTFKAEFENRRYFLARVNHAKH